MLLPPNCRCNMKIPYSFNLIKIFVPQRRSFWTVQNLSCSFTLFCIQGIKMICSRCSSLPYCCQLQSLKCRNVEASTIVSLNETFFPKTSEVDLLSVLKKNICSFTSALHVDYYSCKSIGNHKKSIINNSLKLLMKIVMFISKVIYIICELDFAY